MRDPFSDFIAQRDAAIARGAEYCPICGQVNAWVHDHKRDHSGLDDGPWLPGHAPRKKPAPKTPEETTAIRAAAWATRRAMYGERGHR